MVARELAQRSFTSYLGGEKNQAWVYASPEVRAVGEFRGIGTLGLSGKAMSEATGGPLLMAWGLRVDHVGCLPKRPGYPLPCP